MRRTEARGLPWAAPLCALLLSGCPNPPPSRFPTADDALARMHATYACSRGTSGGAKIDAFVGTGKRLRASVDYIAMLPDEFQLTADLPVVHGVAMEVTTDGNQFAWLDNRERVFFHGPASPCNIARVTGVPLPPFALIQLLRGEAPVLVHQPSATSIAWEGDSYVLRIPSKHDAMEEIRLVPTPADWNRPWAEQRVRVLGVRVQQQGIDLYSAELKNHAVANTAAVDSDSPAPPSGPECHAEVPRKLRVEVPGTDRDMVMDVKEVEHNPALTGRPFEQSPPLGFAVRYSDCLR